VVNLFFASSIILFFLFYFCSNNEFLNKTRLLFKWIQAITLSNVIEIASPLVSTIFQYILVGPSLSDFSRDKIPIILREISSFIYLVDQRCSRAGDQVSISSTFYVQLLHVQIPKVQKRLTTWLSSFLRLKAARRTLMKLTTGAGVGWLIDNLILHLSGFCQAFCIWKKLSFSCYLILH